MRGWLSVREAGQRPAAGKAPLTGHAAGWGEHVLKHRNSGFVLKSDPAQMELRKDSVRKKPGRQRRASRFIQKQEPLRVPPNAAAHRWRWAGRASGPGAGTSVACRAARPGCWVPSWSSPPRAPAPGISARGSDGRR